jgi:hypothetical protein
MASLTESVVKSAALAWLEALGYAVKRCPVIAAGESVREHYAHCESETARPPFRGRS